MARYSLISRGVLIAGAGGFIGRALTAKLFAAAPARRLTGDLSDPAYCSRLLRRVHTVYYLAGLKQNLQHHLAEPFRFIDGNVRPLLTFLSAAGKSSLKQIMYLSSTIVEYAGSQEQFDGYVVGKNMSEHMLSAFAKQYPRIEVKLLRSAPVYGPGDNFYKATANFIPATIRKVKAAHHEVPVWGSGKRKLQFIYIDDLVRNLVAAEKSKARYFVIGNSQTVSVNEVVRLIIKISGKKLTVSNQARGPDKPTRLAKFNNLIKPRVSLAAGLTKTWEYFLRHA